MPDASNRKRSLSPEAARREQHGRQRSRAACAPCKKRKRKCDGREPCSTCVRYEYRCEYYTTKRSPVLPNGHVISEPAQESPATEAPPSITALQKHPHTGSGVSFHHRSILDPVKTRFVRANSAICFPRILGLEMESESIPRLHSFAWHLGVRAEPVEAVVVITTLLTWAEMQHLSRSYFTQVKPEFGLLDEGEFNEQTAARFATPTGFNDFDAVALGVAALGSFFAPNPHPHEETFAADSRNILVNRGLIHQPTSNNIAGWILRTIYLRLTSRPQASWLASCITMHQVEASGLHKELQTIAVVYPALPSGHRELSKTRRRLFWISRALNIILSFEYGRSRVNFDVVTTKRFAAEPGSHATQFVELAEILPTDFVDREREPDPPAALSTALTKLEELESDSAFINLLKADLAFAIYRRLWLMSLTDAKGRAESAISIGKAGLSASAKLLETRKPWWNVLHAPFQFICVVLAVGTPKSLAHIQDIMALLHRIALTYDTHMVREAYSQATSLVEMARKRKEKELEALSAVPQAPPYAGRPSAEPSSTMTDVPHLDWATLDLPFEWETFLNPELVMSTPHDGFDPRLQF